MRACVLPVIFCCVLVSCDKGYRIRFSNYYTSPIDSVSVGSRIHFTDVPVHETTQSVKIERGTYPVLIIARDRARFRTSVFISGKGEGTRTIQIDAARQLQILEE